jgi:hypothetical protein
MAAGETSRLSVSGDEFRNQLVPRNLYNLDNEYVVNGNLTPKNNSKVADTLSSIIGVIPQWQGISQKANLASRLLPNQSPLAEIGSIMLAQQLFYNSIAHISQQYLPTLDLSQALKGKNPIIKHVNWSITVNNEDKSFLDKVGGFVSKTFFNSNSIGSLPDITSNENLIKNTGSAQIEKYKDSINQNIFNGSSEENQNSNIRITDNKNYFSFNDVNNYPYYKYLSTATANSNFGANLLMRMSYTGGTYAPTYDSITYFGFTIKNDNQFSNTNTSDNNNSSNSDYYGLIGSQSADEIDNSNTGDKLVWGNLQNLDDFKIKTGLLYYTQQLLNATDGNFVDITKKVFKDEKGNVIGFNGAPLWQSNNSTYAKKAVNKEEEPNGSKYGIRQHTILDPYNRFAKAIRFNGNSVYGGNPNSVIYNTVLPRIHPTKNDKGVIDSKNLMFSIENLAIGTVARETYGVIDDEWGTAIPLSEVGPFAGRLMWFPPYDIQLNETATAKWESTVMVGRNEPMYNYQNSERTATLSFTLLIDYPEQLRNYISTSNDKNKVIADFFAFGGEPLTINEREITEYTKQIETLKGQIPVISSPDIPADPEPVNVTPVTIYFPNDEPNDNNINTIIDEMYNNPRHYEIIKGCESQEDENGFGLNEFIYYRTGLSGTSKTGYVLTATTVSQYNIGEVPDQFGDCKLNKDLKDVFGNVDNRKFYNVEIEGGSSKLYLNKNQEEYNKALGQRRIQAATKLVASRLKAIFPDITDADINKIIIQKESTGSEGGSVDGEKPENIALENVKKERRATITIKRSTDNPEAIEKPINQDQQNDIDKIQQQIVDLNDKIITLRNVLDNNVLNDRSAANAIQYGFTSISGNFFNPAYHSQTPEEFHRRLTFLQQCVRQGAAKRYDVIDENGDLRARNSVFGRQPICILRVGDFWYTKVVIDSVTIDYNETTWDTNPEGFGMQPMIAKVTLQMKVIGGQSLKGPIDALQNAVAFNYYANSTFSDKGMYSRPSKVADNQYSYMFGVDGQVTQKIKGLNDAYDAIIAKNTQ